MAPEISAKAPPTDWQCGMDVGWLCKSGDSAYKSR